MGLISNASRLYFDGVIEGSAHALMPGNWTSYQQHRKFIERDDEVLETAANPTGYYYPRAFQPPITSGDMSMRPQGSGSLAANLLPTRAMSIDLTGSGDMGATAALVISMLCAMTGSGTLTAAIEGRLAMSIDFTGSGNLEGAMQGIASMAADLSGSGDLDATIAAYGNMAIDIVVTGTGLSTANVGQAVWAALQAQINNPGTAGAALLAAGSAGDPWSTALPGAYGAGTAGALLSALINGLTPDQVAQLLDVWQRLGLDAANPLVTNENTGTIEAGAVSQTAVTAPAGVTTITRLP